MLPGLAEILAAAPQTKWLELHPGAVEEAPAIFNRHFPGRTPLVTADPATFRVAGEAVLRLLRASGHQRAESFVFADSPFHAEHTFVARLEEKLRENPDAIPVAVGSGTINDVTKLAAHQAGRRYLVAATAASMDGYTAFGASITRRGSKQTFPCAAPLAVVADLSIIAAAPVHLNAAGYADLLAKVTAGADWILADALGVEPIHQKAWELAQGRLREALADPAGVRAGTPSAIEALSEGLLLTGFAMQFASSSRPASGAEHQFSHLWDMQHHTFRGSTPLHGFKVGIGTLAVARLYEFVLAQPLDKLDVDRCCGLWPEADTLEPGIRALFADPSLATVALAETRAKHIGVADLRTQLNALKRLWPALRDRLRRQLLATAELKRMLRDAGAPTQPEEIGVTRGRLRESVQLAYHIRRRFTVLDIIVRAGLLTAAVEDIFGSDRDL